MEDYRKRITLNYKKYFASKLYPNKIALKGKIIHESGNYEENYTRTRLSTNSSKLSIASLIIDKHSSKDCFLSKYIGSP